MIREDKNGEIKNWIMEDGFEERTKARSLLDPGLGSTSTNLVKPCNWRIFDKLWLEFNARRDLC